MKVVVMGTKERDLAFWLFAVFISGAAVFGSMLLWLAAFISALLFFYHFVIVRPRAVRESRKMGLETAVLVPLWSCAARLRLLLAGKKLAGWERAYEVHLSGSGKEIIPVLEKDLLNVAGTVKGLFFWETSFPVPSAIRKLVREKEKRNKAFWVKGRLPVPGTPLLPDPVDGKHVRYGAVVLD